MAENLLTVEERANTGKGNARRLRRQGKVPGIFYARAEKTIPIQMEEREILKILTAAGGLFDLQIGDKKKRKAIIKETQIDPVGQRLSHVDIQGVNLKEKITIEVPIRIIGDAKGVKEQGGILHQYLREVEISCLPLDIPEHIDVDVTQLNIGDAITIQQLSAENVTFLQDSDQPVVSVLSPMIVEKPAAEAEVEEVAATEEEKEEESGK